MKMMRMKVNTRTHTQDQKQMIRLVGKRVFGKQVAHTVEEEREEDKGNDEDDFDVNYAVNYLDLTTPTTLNESEDNFCCACKSNVRKCSIAQAS